MVGVRELVEQGQPLNVVSERQGFQVLAQRLRIAGDIENSWLRLHHLHSLVIQPAAWRIDEDRFALIAF